MFCYQCQEAAKGTGCVLRGVCGKKDTTARYMDLLLFVVRGVSVAADALRTKGYEVETGTNEFVTDALFSTITNANFDDESILARVRKGLELRDCLKARAVKAGIVLPEADELTWNGKEEEYLSKSASVGVLREPNEDLRSLKELLMYGLKGMAAYHEHAMRLGFADEAIHAFMQSALARITTQTMGADELVALVLEAGQHGVQVMALLDRANTTRYGHPELTKVNIGVGKNPGILISGHDLHDLEELLRQTEGTGVDVYTHSEMLPGHYYPAFKKYKHFVGNYGNAWWKQREEFTAFNGPIVFTTNCIVPPLENATYKERMFTANSTGYPGCKHIVLFFYVILQDNLSDVVENARFCKLIANFFFIPQFPRKIVSQITHFHAVDELFGQGISQHVKLLTGFFFHFGRYFSIPIRFLSIISSIRST